MSEFCIKKKRKKKKKKKEKKTKKKKKNENKEKKENKEKIYMTSESIRVRGFSQVHPLVGNQNHWTGGFGLMMEFLETKFIFKSEHVQNRDFWLVDRDHVKSL